jgi:hypothetical protein
MQALDNLWKSKLGRLGFDSSRPWYEENNAADSLIKINSIMSDQIPITLPSLLNGGVLVTTEELYASDGSIVTSEAINGGTGVIKRNIRLPLYALNAYKNSENRRYVFKDSGLRLQRIRVEFGYVIECINIDGDIGIVNEEYSVLNGHVIFSSPQSETYFISFFEYTGKLGVDITSITTVVEPQITSTPPLSEMNSSDDLVEGLVNKFLTLSNLSSMMHMITTDDIPEGASSKYFDVHGVLSISRTQIDETLQSLKTADIQEDGALYFTEERVRDVAAALRISSFNDDDTSLHFNLHSLKSKLQECDSSDIKEGDNLYFTYERAISVCKFLESGYVVETTNLYFTNDRARLALQPELNVITNEVNSLTLDSINIGSDPFVRQIEYDATLLSLSAPKTTADIEENSNGPHYFTQERTLACVSHRFQETESLMNRLIVSVSSVIDKLDTSHIAEHSSKRFFSETLLKEYASVITTDDITEGCRAFFDKNENDTAITRIATSICDESITELKNSWDVVTTSQLNELTTDSIQEGANMFFTSPRVLEVVHNLTSVPPVIQNSFLTITGHANKWRELFSQQTTDDLTEGSVHKFFNAASVSDIIRNTNIDELVAGESTYSLEKVRSVIDSLSLDDIQDGIIRKLMTQSSVDSWLRTKTTDDIKEGETMLYWSSDKASDLAHSVNMSISQIIPRTTDDISEGLNLYYSDARVNTVVDSKLGDYTTTSGIQVLINEERSVTSHDVSQTKQDILLSVSNLRTTDIEEGSRLYFSHERCLSSASTLTLDEIQDGHVRHLLTGDDIISNVQSKLLDGTITLDTYLLNETPGALWHTNERVMEAIQPSLLDINGSIHSIQSRLTNLQFSSNTLSDDRLKFNEVELTAALSVMMMISPMAYDMVLSLGATPTTSESFHDVGFIAQDLLSIASLSHAVVPGDDSTPFSLDYHSITTFAVGAIKELAVKNLDSIPEGDINKHLTQSNFDMFSQPIIDRISELTTSNITEGDSLYFNDERFVSSLVRFSHLITPDLEQFRYLLTHITTDDIIEGSNNKYDSVLTLTTDDVIEGSRKYFTYERCLSVCSNLVSNRFSNITTDDIQESETNRYMTLESLINLLQFTTADHIGNGRNNKFLNLDSFLLLNITTSHVQEGEYLYFTSDRCVAAVSGMSSDNWVEGDVNKYATPQNVRTALIGSTTDNLAEGEINKYVTRESFFSLNISTGDIIGNELLATRIELNELERTLRTEDEQNALSLSAIIDHVSQEFQSGLLSVSTQMQTENQNINNLFNEKLLSVSNVFNPNISVAQYEQLSISNSNLENALSVSSLRIESNMLSLHQYQTSVDVSLGGAIDTLSTIQELLTLSVNESLLNTVSTSETLNNEKLSLAYDRIDDLDLSLSVTMNDQNSALLQLISINTLNLDSNVSQINSSISVSFLNTLSTASSAVEELKGEVYNQFALSSTVQNLTTDDINEGNKKYVSIESLTAVNLSTDHINEGSSLFFTDERVMHILSISSTDDLQQGQNNLYVTKPNVLALDIHLNELSGYSELILSTGGDLVTDEIFMERLNRLVTTDTIQEGVVNSYTSTESVRNALTGITTDDIQQGNSKYVSEESIASVINSNMILNTGITAVDIGARPIGVTISSSEVTEHEHLFFTDQRVRDVVSTLTADDVAEGLTNVFYTDDRVVNVISQINTNSISEGSSLYFTTERVISSLSIATSDNIREGTQNRYVTKDNVRSVVTTDDIAEGTAKYFDSQLVYDALSVSPDPPNVTVLTNDGGDATVTISFDTRTCARVNASVYDNGVLISEQESISIQTLMFTFRLLPIGRPLILVVELQTPNGTRSTETSFSVTEIPLSIQNVSILQSNQGGVTGIVANTTSNGSCVLRLKSGTQTLFTKSFYADGSTMEHVVDINFVFTNVQVELSRGDDSVVSTISNSLPLIIDVSEEMAIFTDASYTNELLFDGVNISINLSNNILNGNKYANDRFSQNGVVVSSTETQLVFGVSNGSMLISLTGDTTFFRCTTVDS